MIQDLEDQVRRAADACFGVGVGARITGGFNNVRGDWLEQILAVIFANLTATGEYGNTVITRLPNTGTMPYQELFGPTARAYLTDLYDSLEEHHISMTMSNPDFVCVTNLSDEVFAAIRGPFTLKVTDIETLWDAYKSIQGRCDPFHIPFVLTVKTSVRPDRRYQIVHEANIVKALAAHLASRYWKRDLYIPFYALIAGPVSDSDRKVLRNPVTHTLVQVSWDPAPVVDSVYSIDSIAEVQTIISNLLAPLRVR